MIPHLTAALAPLALSTQRLVTYLQGLFRPLSSGIVAIFLPLTREATRLVQFIVLAVAIAAVFYTPSIVPTLATRPARTIALATPGTALRILSVRSDKHRTRLYRSESSRQYAIP
jgi:hypothetical protein